MKNRRFNFKLPIKMNIIGFFFLICKNNGSRMGPTVDVDYISYGTDFLTFVLKNNFIMLDTLSSLNIIESDHVDELIIGFHEFSCDFLNPIGDRGGEKKKLDG